jgi:hypothetical protein
VTDSAPDDGRLIGEDATITFRSCAYRDVPARPLRPHEATVLERMLSQRFDGNELWTAQVPHLRVVGECDRCPTLGFQASAAVQPVLNEEGQPRGPAAAPYELQGLDLDGVPWGAVVLMSGGVISEIDAFRGDNEAFQDAEWWKHGEIVLTADTEPPRDDPARP